MATPSVVSVDLQKDGLLWLINASVLHPRGFALALETDSNELFLMGDGSEPWVFGDGMGDEPFLAVEALLDRARKHNVEAKEPTDA